MVVSKEISHLEHSAVKLSVTIGASDVRTQYDDLIQSYAKSVQIPGFRKGKVPREVLERKFGESLKGEAIGRIMEKSLQELFAAEDFPADARPLPYSTPSVKDEPALDFDKDLSFTVTYDVFPDVKVGVWKGVEVETPVVSVGEEDIARELEQVRERNAVVLDKEDGAKIAKGDVVTVSYCELAQDGSVVPASERQDFAFTVGTGYNVFKFDDEIVGMKKGESKDFDKSYPADFEDKDLAGTTKKLRVSVQTIKEKKLPALDDDLAQDVSEKYKTLADLKADLKANLEKNLENRLRELKINAFLEKALETTVAEIPESMIRVELDNRWHQLTHRFNATDEQLLGIIQASGKTYEDLMADWRPEVEKSLKARLVVEKLMTELGIQIGDDEVEKEFESMAASMGATVEDVKKRYEREDMKSYLREDLKERKLFDLLLAEAKLKKGKKAKYLDLISNNG